MSVPPRRNLSARKSRNGAERTAPKIVRRRCFRSSACRAASRRSPPTPRRPRRGRARSRPPRSPRRGRRARRRRIVFDRRLVGRVIHVGVDDAGNILERRLVRFGAVRTGHVRDPDRPACALGTIAGRLDGLVNLGERCLLGVVLDGGVVGRVIGVRLAHAVEGLQGIADRLRTVRTAHAPNVQVCGPGTH